MHPTLQGIGMTKVSLEMFQNVPKKNSDCSNER